MVSKHVTRDGYVRVNIHLGCGELSMGRMDAERLHLELGLVLQSTEEPPMSMEETKEASSALLRDLNKAGG